MDLYLSEFISGFHTSLNKKADPIFEGPEESSIFSNIESQAKWHFARKDGHIHLSDGNIVHSFHLPSGEDHDYDFPLVKKKDIPFNEFESEGTAQVHKANPGFLYLTLHDGKTNPTYSFKHVSEDQWRASPKVKKAEEAKSIDREAFLAGLQKASEEGMLHNILDYGLKGIGGAAKAGLNTALAPGFNPTMAAGIGLAGGAAYDLGKRHLYNTPEENEQESGLKRALRYAAPAALLGGMGLATSTAFPNYYKHYPVYPV